MISEFAAIVDIPSSLAQWVFNRAGMKIAQCFRDGTFPDMTEIIH